MWILYYTDSTRLEKKQNFEKSSRRAKVGLKLMRDKKAGLGVGREETSLCILVYSSACLKCPYSIGNNNMDGGKKRKEKKRKLEGSPRQAKAWRRVLMPPRGS